MLDTFPGNHHRVIEFLTAAEYESRVGAERYRYETVEKLSQESP
jgi:hypothetical protein